MVIIICGANKLSGKLQNIKLEVIFLKLNNDLCELIAESLRSVGRIAICPGIGDWCERSKHQDRRSQRSKNLCNHVFYERNQLV